MHYTAETKRVPQVSRIKKMFRPPRMRPAAPPRLLNDDEMLNIGLEQVGFDLYRQNSVLRATNVLRFVSHYGSTPLVYAAVWKDLTTTEIPEAKIAAGTAPDKCFLGKYFLKVYPTEEKLAACFKVCKKAARKWALIFACKIQALKAKKVSCYSSSITVGLKTDTTTTLILKSTFLK